MADPTPIKKKFNINIEETLIKVIINAVVLSAVSWFAIQSGIEHQMIEVKRDILYVKEDISEIKSEYVQYNEFESTRVLALENKITIIEQSKQLQQHEVLLSLINSK